MLEPRGRRMLLTANGICNDTLLHTLTDLVDRPLAECRLLVVLTATLGSDGDKRWLIDSLAHLAGLGWTSIDLVDVAAPTPDLGERFEAADVVYVQGGNQYVLPRRSSATAWRRCSSRSAARRCTSDRAPAR
ncbi:hypothetical protein ACFWQC_25900 [Nocardioides sp. NPDC058538]|uniref:hypothetical protein n=1 Tax=Nocardioides sp. NPDC058538 TaxID=3346542 RepID=UPI003665BCA2